MSNLLFFPGECNAAVLKNVQHFLSLSEGTYVNGKFTKATVNNDLQDKKEFHNPGILEYLMTSYSIKEIG